LADVLVNYSVAVREGERVAIVGETAAAPLLKAVFACVLQAGGYPFLLPTLSGASELFFRHASDEQLQYVHEPVRLVMENYDVLINILGVENTKALSNADPAKMARRSLAEKDMMETFARRSAAGETRWVIGLFPGQAEAQDAEMSLSEYEDFVYGACMPDEDAPVGYWRGVSAWQQRIVDWLAGKERVRVVGPETDVQLSIAGRTFINSDGRHNMPSGEVFTSPVEDSAEGRVYFSYPAIYRGHEVAGVRLWIEKGQVVRATAEKNEAFLLEMLETDEGARRFGEFAIGTNKGITRFTRQILFDEKINGSFHLALGRGFPEAGGKNTSAIHWDLICDMRAGGEIWVDEELLYKDGEFVVAF
jgi:aminopeptidase